jgi:uncharacterized damage-inducible protein DinB
MDFAETLAEFRQEAATTGRVLDRIPEDKLEWRPHPKSMSLGELALHIARVPGGIASLTQLSSFDISARKPPNPPPNLAAIRSAFEDSVGKVEALLSSASPEDGAKTWTVMNGDKVVATSSRAAAWRSIMLNHWYHHRGQLSVYLRLLDVPVPSIYGASADEPPPGQ